MKQGIAMRHGFGSKIRQTAVALPGILIMIGLANALVIDSDEIPEIGKVEWTSDLESAKQASAESGRPVLLLFQEIPG